MTKAEVLEMINKLDDDKEIVLSVQGATFNEFYIVEGVDEEMDIINNEITCDQLN